MKQLAKIALGGGCHWCTEAMFQSLKGVDNVEQGYVASTNENNVFSEAVIVHFNSEKISLKTLVEIHLHTHKSTSNHSMRDKYRSAVYTFSKKQTQEVLDTMSIQQSKFKEELITKVLPFVSFKVSHEQIQNYYYKNPKKPFCKTFINPKLRLLLQRYTESVSQEKLKNSAL